MSCCVKEKCLNTEVLIPAETYFDILLLGWKEITSILGNSNLILLSYRSGSHTSSTCYCLL